jgi:hypothetical protein
MKKLLIGFIRDEQGQDLVEYALIVAAIGLALKHSPGPDYHWHQRRIRLD